MELRSIRTFSFWLFLTILFAVLAGFEIAVTISYARRHLDLFDLPYIGAPILSAAMLLWAVNSGIRLVSFYRNALIAYDKKDAALAATSNMSAG